MVEADVEGNDLGPILPDAYRIKLRGCQCINPRFG